MTPYIPYVYTRMGTKSVERYSNGNTLPLVSRPFGMAPFSVQTDHCERWFFQPDLPYTEGVRLTHQPSPWISDYGTFLMMPQNDCIRDASNLSWSGYRIPDAVMDPDYLKITLLRPQVTFELTPTDRCGAIRMTFGNDRPSVLSFFPTKGNYKWRLDQASGVVYGVTDGHSGDLSVNFRTYVAVRFSEGALDASRTECRGEGTGACIHVGLHTHKGAVIEARLGISYISEEMALAAIDRECGDKPFDALREECRELWESMLHRIEIEAETEEEMKTFYSCLYRAFLFPHKCYELDADGKPLHYTPCDGRIRPGVRYTDNGFWDTYRTVYPLFALIAREEYAEMLEGFVSEYKECGWLPRWLSMGEVGCMPSTTIDGVIAHAAVHGIGSREVLETALEGMLHHANHAASDRRYGRDGVLSYLKYGYVPREEQRESVNLTLDAAYGDWCIARVAEILGRNELVPEYDRRALNYKNLFDPATGFMRGRDRNGEMDPSFDPTIWGVEYTEGGAWQSTFSVPHDVEGLAALYGSRDAFLAKVDELFAAAPEYRVHGYGEEIHEMTEMGTSDYGQCAISNQPSFSLPYLYAAVGETEKSSYWVRRLCAEAFHATDDGFPGDEDNGTMASWYIFSMLGMYPFCPGKKEMVHIPPILKSAKMLGEKLF